MNCSTVDEYRRKLAEVITDPDVIKYAVARKFPPPQPISGRKFDATGRTKPSERDPDYYCGDNVRYEKNMALRNEIFVSALTRELREISRRARARKRAMIG